MKLSELRHTEIVAHFKGMIAFTRMTFRDFTSQMEDFTGRSVDNDAPPGLRQEFIDLAFHTFEKDQHFDESRLHKIITQNLGFAASGQPYGGFRYAAGRDITRPKWAARLRPNLSAMGRASDQLAARIPHRRQSHPSGLQCCLGPWRRRPTPSDLATCRSKASRRGIPRVEPESVCSSACLIPGSDQCV